MLYAAGLTKVNFNLSLCGNVCLLSGCSGRRDHNDYWLCHPPKKQVTLGGLQLLAEESWPQSLLRLLAACRCHMVEWQGELAHHLNKHSSFCQSVSLWVCLPIPNKNCTTHKCLFRIKNSCFYGGILRMRIKGTQIYSFMHVSKLFFPLGQRRDGDTRQREGGQFL